MQYSSPLLLRCYSVATAAALLVLGVFLGQYFIVQPAYAAVGLEIREATCATASSTFTLGETVCARATGLGSAGTHHIEWFNPSSVLKDTSANNASGNMTDTYVPDSTGTWTVKVIKNSDSSVQATATFTVNAATGHIVVDKVTVPSGESQSFSFDASGGSYGDFSLTDTAAPNDQTLAAGNYSVSETVPAGWDLTSTNCVSSIGDTETAGSLELDAGETITCTFTNTKRGHIIVNKVTDPPQDPQSFDFDATGSGYNDFSLTDTDTPDDQEVVPGAYTVSETVPAGWDSDGGVCDLGETPASLDVDPGETVTCTFTNTKRGHIIVQKTTDPSGDLTEFDITASGSFDPINGTAGTVTDASDHDYEVKAGTYSVAETPVAGWDETGNTCSNVVVDPGETEYCLITNVKKGKLTIAKDSDPNDLMDFSFTGTSPIGSFLLDDDAGVVDAGVPPDIDQDPSKIFTLSAGADYTVTETIPNPYWILKGIDCVLTGTSTPYPVVSVTNGVTVSITPGVEVTCTFKNEKISPTRGQGFWKNHTAFTTGVFGSPPLSGSMLIGNGTTHKGPVDSAAKIFGAYFSHNAKKTTGANRSAVDKARMTLLQQLVIAKLNCAAFGCTAAVQTLIANADAAYASGPANAIRPYIDPLDVYNKSGETLIASPPLPPPGKATPKLSEAAANKTFWDDP